jgi:hypothetical protein
MRSSLQLLQVYDRSKQCATQCMDCVCCSKALLLKCQVSNLLLLLFFAHAAGCWCTQAA